MAAGQLTGLHVKITGDSTSLSTAAKRSQFELNKLEAKAREAKKATEALASGSAALAKEFNRLKMETDSSYAAMQRFESASRLVAKVAKDQKWSAEQLSAELSRLANHYGIAEQAGYSMNEQVRSARFHTANLAAQFNDIGVMMAAGQSPFMLAIQQGTQISQVLNDMGGGVRQTFSALGGAFMSLLSPVSLLTIGLIAGTAALVQWGMEAIGAGEKTVSVIDAVDALGSTMSKYIEYAKLAATDTATLAEQFGGFAGQVKEFSAYMAGVSLADTMDELNNVMVPLKETLGGFERLLADVAMQEAEVTRLTEQFKQGITEFSVVQTATDMLDGFRANLEASAGSLGLTVEQASRLNSLMTELGKAQSMAEIARAAGAVLNYMKQIVPAGQDLPKPLREAAAALETMQQKAAQATVEATKLGDAAPGSGWLGTAITETNALISRLILANAEKDKLLARSGANYEAELALTGQSSGPDSARTKVQFGGGAFAAPVKGAGLPYVAAAGGGGGGGQNAADKIQAELDQLQNTLMTAEQMEMESYARRQELLQQALDQKLITTQEHANLMEQIEATHQFALFKEQKKGAQNALSALGTIFQGSKKIGAAIAVANSWLAFTEVLKDPAYVGRPWARFINAAAALSAGMNAVRNIKSASPGGATGGGGAGGGASGGDAGAGAPQQNVQTLNFTIMNDPFGFGERFARDMAAKLNEAQRNGSTLIRATVT